MVVAVCALVFAMVGSAVAGTDGLSNKITKAKVKKIAKKQISKAEPGLSVANAATATKALSADTATLADKATTADTATTADSATTATNATNAVNAENADNATNADNADNADALGGLSANNYVRRFFAKVAYTAGPPAIIAGSPGVTAGGEGGVGFPRINFPQSMNNCAVIAMTSQAAGTSIVRHSSAVSGTQVQLAIQDGANAAVRENFSIVGIC